MSFTEAVRSVFRNYATFDGRAPRSEYWWFQLFNVLVGLSAYLVLFFLLVTTREYLALGLFALGLLIYGLFVFIPSLAVTVRRMHDSDKSGWWLLIGFVPWIGGLIILIFMVLPSTPGMNRFGPPFGMSGLIHRARYAGPSPSDAWASYTEDAMRAAAAGYEPVSQQWRRDGSGDYLEVIYQATFQPPWRAPGTGQWMAGTDFRPHPFDGPTTASGSSK